MAHKTAAKKTPRSSLVVGLVVRPGLPRALELAHEVKKFLEKRKITLLPEEHTAKAMRLTGGVSKQELALRADPIVVLGGDGTLIGIAHYVEKKAPVLVGVNFGQLGFLTELAPSELMSTLAKLLDGNVRVGARAMISARVLREGKQIFYAQAVNDVTVIKGAKAPLIEIDCTVDKEALMRLRADGMIVATGTGSTAYSLAAGGSIVYPTLPVMLVTPICPHSLTVRPLVLPNDKVVELSIPEYGGEVVLSVDGQLTCAVQPGDQILITKAKNSVKFVISPTRGYFEILRTKLNWGIANQS